jgi:hypothetical protein
VPEVLPVTPTATKKPRRECAALSVGNCLRAVCRWVQARFEKPVAEGGTGRWAHVQLTEVRAAEERLESCTS